MYINWNILWWTMEQYILYVEVEYLNKRKIYRWKECDEWLSIR